MDRLGHNCPEAGYALPGRLPACLGPRHDAGESCTNQRNVYAAPNPCLPCIQSPKQQPRAVPTSQSDVLTCMVGSLLEERLLAAYRRPSRCPVEPHWLAVTGWRLGWSRQAACLLCSGTWRVSQARVGLPPAAAGSSRGCRLICRGHRAFEAARCGSPNTASRWWLSPGR